MRDLDLPSDISIVIHEKKERERSEFRETIEVARRRVPFPTHDFFNTDREEATHSHIPVGSRSVEKVPSNFVALTPYTRVLYFRFSQRYLGRVIMRLQGLPSDISVNTYITRLHMCTKANENIILLVADVIHRTNVRIAKKLT